MKNKILKKIFISLIAIFMTGVNCMPVAAAKIDKVQGIVAEKDVQEVKEETLYPTVQNIDEDNNAESSIDDLISIEFKGGSLRMDKTLNDGSADPSETSLRFGYQVNIKKDSDINVEAWGWNYGVAADKLNFSAIGSKKVVITDGFVSNLVMTDISKKHYKDKIYEQMWVRYQKKDGETYTVTGDVEARSVEKVVTDIRASGTASQKEKAYADALYLVIDDENWTGYY